MSGRLVLVVGPSGVGKDALLAWVARRLGPGSPIRILRRLVTRPARDGDDHLPLCPDCLRAWQEAGGTAFGWSANGCDYAVPAVLDDLLALGGVVVVSASREALPRILVHHPTAAVAWILASPRTLAERLAARGRETGTGIHRRLARALRHPPPTGLDGLTVIHNDGPIEEAGARLLDLLLTLARPGQPVEV